MKTWLEMGDLLHQNPLNKAWITVYKYHNESNNKYNEINYKDEAILINSVLVYAEDFYKNSKSLHYCDLIHAPNEDRYFTPSRDYLKVDELCIYDESMKGEHFVFKRTHPFTNQTELHISYDFISTLGLYKKDENYVDPMKNDEIVVKCSVDNDNYSIEIRKEYLLDYLSARNLNLLQEFYEQRIFHTDANLMISEERIELPCFQFNKQVIMPEENQDEEWMLFDAFYSENNEEVPIFNPAEANLKQAAVTIARPKLYKYQTEFRKFYLLPNNGVSTIIRHDPENQEFFYYVDNNNKKIFTTEIQKQVRFLWFKPEVVKNFLKEKYVSISWLCKDVFRIRLNNDMILAGINPIGLITVYAGDILKLPVYSQSKWNSFNCTPDGGVCSELLQIEAYDKVPSTISPEINIKKGIYYLDKIYKQKYGDNLFKTEIYSDDFSKLVNRLNAIDQSDCFNVCKNFNNFITERISNDVLKKQTSTLNKDSKVLKRLENIVNTLNPENNNIIGPLFVAYDMRIKDAHISDSDDQIFSRLGISVTGVELNFVNITEQILQKLSDSIWGIAKIIEDSITDTDE